MHTQRVGFNRQEQDVYLLPILVVDSGPPPLSSTGTLTIRICGCDSNGAIQSCNSTAYAMSATLSPGALIALLVCVLILIGECCPAPAALSHPACNPAPTWPLCPLTPCCWLTTLWRAGGQGSCGGSSFFSAPHVALWVQPKHSCPCHGWVGAKSHVQAAKLFWQQASGCKRGMCVSQHRGQGWWARGVQSHLEHRMAGSELEQAGRIEVRCMQTRALPRTGSVPAACGAQLLLSALARALALERKDTA